MVQSHIGSKGGFSLAKLATSISIKDVYETVERPLVLMDCLQRGADYCSYCSVCTQKSIWEEAQKVLAEFLGRVSINDIADRQGIERTISRKSAEGGLRSRFGVAKCWK